MLKSFGHPSWSNIVLVVSLVTILVLLLAFGGCSTPISAAELNASAVSKYTSVTSVKCDMTLKSDISLISNGETKNISLSANKRSIYDYANKQFQITENMDNPIMDNDQVYLIEEYLSGEWLYTKVGPQENNNKWMKQKITSDFWPSENQGIQQIELLKSASRVEMLENEKVDTIDCYVEKFTSENGKLFEWLMSGMRSSNSLFSALYNKVNPAKWIDNVMIKYWIAKDSRFIIKSEISIHMSYASSDLDMTSEESEDDYFPVDEATDEENNTAGYTANTSSNMTATLTEQMKFYDHNKPVSIVLPAETANAWEMPDFSQFK
jgi:hypothetical protein